MKKILGLFLLFGCFGLVGCTNANEGTVRVRTIRGKIDKVIRPDDQWVATVNQLGDEYYDVNIKSVTRHIEIAATSKDNAELSIPVNLTIHILPDDASVIAHLRRFGLDETERGTNYFRLLEGHASTAGKSAITQFDAYELLANQQNIQNIIDKTLKPIFKEQLETELESVQVLGRPEFKDRRIPEAASAVVANQKAKEASLAALEAAKVDNDRKQLEAKMFENPQMLKIKELELQKDIETARADGIKGHQGPLTIIYGGTSSSMQLRPSAGDK